MSRLEIELDIQAVSVQYFNDHMNLFIARHKIIVIKLSYSGLINSPIHRLSPRVSGAYS